MKIREKASEFTVYVLACDIDRGVGMKVSLSRAGYESYFFEDQEILFSRIRQMAPHIVIFQTAALRESLSDFFEKILTLNSEIRLILLAHPSQFETLAAYNDYGLVDILEDQEEGLAPRAVFAVDRACERLYLQYQNELLLNEATRWKQSSLQKDASLKEKDQHLAQRGPPLEARIKEYLLSESKEDLMARFMINLEEMPCVSLKFLPSVNSLVVMGATIFSPAQIKGVGCQLTREEAKDFSTQISVGMIPPSLRTLLKDAFQFYPARLMPLFVQGELEGVIAYPANVPSENRNRIEDETCLLALAYSKLSLEKRLQQIETNDPLTGLYNRKCYRQRLNEEAARARRQQQPLSVMKLCLDRFTEVEESMGEGPRDQLVKNLTQLLLKSGRTEDIACRTGQNEFTLIMPNCGRQEAMVRGERLRRVVETSQILEHGIKISISIGISELPALANTAESLEDSASRALSHIQAKGGNRLCLSKAPAGYQPEFAVTPEPRT